ncbi:MAG: PH domain-containing protein [Rikenellaceae bacterium]
MKSSRYNYHLDRVCIYWSILHFIGFVVIGMLLYYFYVGGFFTAWFISFGIAAIILMVLSVPRYVAIEGNKLNISCVLDNTEIKLHNITSIRKISPRRIRWVLPIFGGCGFWGYYGHFFDLRHFRKVMIYATEWRYLVEIVDIYEDYYYISCRDRDKLIDEVEIKRVLFEVESEQTQRLRAQRGSL